MKAFFARLFPWFFSAPEPLPAFRMVENLAGTWSYHLAQGQKNQALCDPAVRVMDSPSPLSNWGYRGHLNERYCRACEEKARAEGVVGLGDG